MKTLDPALATHLSARLGIDAHVLVWIEAVDRVTRAAAPFGLWTGDDDRTMTTDGMPRLYLGAGKLIEVGELVSETGYVVRVTRMTVAHLDPDIAALLAARDIRLQRCVWHQAHLVPGSHDLVAAPRLLFKGRVERVSLPDAEQDGETAAEVEMASYARDMTRPLTVKKSDEALRATYAGDLFRQYIAVSGKISTSWGEARANAPGSPSGGFGDRSGFGPG